MDGPNSYYTHQLIGGGPNPNPSSGSTGHVDRSPTSDAPAKRKRGRPRKYGPDAPMSLALSPLSSPGVGSGSGSDGAKRRGRPPGSGKRQQLALLGEWVLSSAGTGFTPHVIIISEGEDIAAKVMSFSQQGPRAVCIISANGVVSRVALQQPETSGSTITYEGRFEILSMSGSYLLTEDNGSRSRNGGLNISLSSPDGRVFGGGVGGLLVAASTVQIIVGSFVYSGAKGKSISACQESSISSELQTCEKPTIMPCSVEPDRSRTDSTMTRGWHGIREIDLQTSRMNIDLMQD